MKLRYKRKIRYVRKRRLGRRRRRKQLKLCQVAILLFVVVIVFRGFFVDAGMNDSKLEKNRIDGIYAVTNLNGENRLFYLNMYTLNGIVSYCIDMGVDITTDIYHSTTDFKVSKLTTQQIEYIRAISYFGYMYPGHEDYRYYMAAQELIWEYISRAKVEWTNEENINGSRIDIKSYKNDILYLREKYYGGLYFGSIPKGGIFDLGETVAIEDSSGLLSEYEVSSSGHSKAWIDGNNLVIQVANDYVGEETIELTRKDIYNDSNKLYYYDTSQRLISAGNFWKKVDKFSFFIRGDYLKFLLVDGKTGQSIPSGQASFDGVSYELYDDSGNLLKTISMGDDVVEVIVDDLAYGDYVVRQMGTGNGYRLNTDDILISFYEDTEVVVLSLYPDYQEVELFKVYDEGGKGIYQPEKGISFSIYDNTGNFYDSMMTNENGLAMISLPYGSYRIHQDNTTFGYDLIEDFEIFVDPSVDERVRYDLINRFIDCQLKIVVSDNDFLDANLGAGFEFKVWDYAQGKYLDIDGKDVFVTDENGMLVLPILIGYGNYRVEQVGVPAGFVDLEQEIELLINDHSEFQVEDGKLEVVVNFSQQMILGEVHILTEKEVFSMVENDYKYKMIVRPNVDLELISQEDIIVYGNVLYEKDSIIQTISTNKEGKVDISSLYLGKYCLKEKISGIQECFELSIPKKGIDKVSVDVKLQLLLKKFNVVIFNKSELGDGIKDTVIEVINQEKQVFYTGMTDEEGKMKVQFLPSGEYCFRQKKIDDRYLFIEEDLCIIIDNSKDGWEIEMINRLAPKRWIEVPNTLEDGESVVKLASLIIFIGLGGYFYRKKSSNHCSL